MKMAKINFTQLEKETLVELIEERRSIVEGKKNDVTSIKRKEEAWEIITVNFNSRVGVNKRSDKQLRGLWKNLKSQTRKDVASDRRERVKLVAEH